ncbi:MAG: hypothetical protein M1825_001657 [Sarcosagium campestre]|nr:MAG: hypothetical protein M1825_001657 [Sarcosagium campestre]
MWGILESAFREINTKNASELSFEQLYRTAYQMVILEKGDALYDRVKKFINTWLSENVLDKIRDSLSGGLVTVAAGGVDNTTSYEKTLAGEKFLTSLRESWQDHNLCMGMMTDVLMYMDRLYNYHRPPIFPASMGWFRDSIIRASLNPSNTEVDVNHIINTIMLDHIQMEREGDVIDNHLIRSCAYMLEGLYESDGEDENEKLYLTSFEPEFLVSSEAFYQAEGNALSRSLDAASFLRHASRRLAEEQDRCRSTISPLTAPKITAVVEQELIRPFLQDIVNMEGSGARYMLDNDRFGELKLLYELSVRVDAKKLALTGAIQEAISTNGTKINEATAMSNVQAAQNEGAEDDDAAPKTQAATAQSNQTAAAIRWVDDVLELKGKYDRIWTRSFESDGDLQSSITKSFSAFVNAFFRSAEFISLFIDENLRKGLKGKTESEVDEILDKAIVLLRYVQDKDMFERYYKKHLSRRLLTNKLVSGEYERQMISRMKMEVGNHFTQKLEGMFRDMSLSEDLCSGYKTQVAALDDVNLSTLDLSVNVLTSTFWPMEIFGAAAGEDSTQKGSVFPPGIARIKSSFENYYLGKHTGRKMTWLANMGTADIRAVFRGKDGKERKHEINVSTYAMIILLLFNDLPKGGFFTFEELQAKTMIPTADLIRNLLSLAVAAKTRILRKDPMSKEFNPEDKFFFNHNFSSKFLKFKVGVVVGRGVEGDKERKETQKRNDEDRAGIIEAAIVRIMKQRKELHHSTLQAELLAQLSGRFAPDMTMIKRRIESLIEREYLERVDGSEKAAYRYLA